MRVFSVVLSVVFVLGIRSVQASAQNASSAASPAGVVSNAPAFKPFAVYSTKPGHKMHYVPSGYMGDSDVTLSAANLKTAEGKEEPALKVNYKASGAKGWVGIYWQDPANNWGERSGKAGYDLRGAARLRFRAKGDKGGERVKEFRVGGITGKYPDSDVANLTNVRLTQEWQSYTIDLTGKDLRHIIGGFGIFLSKAENRRGAIIYLDHIVYEGTDTPAVVSQEPVDAPPVGRETVPTPKPTVKTEATKDLDIKEVETGLKVSFSSTLMFPTGKAVLQPQSSKVLNQLISLLSAYPKNNVLVEGHTDSTGTKAFNLKLSELRAQSVRDYLIANGGFDKARFQVTGYGDTKPVADNTTRSGRSLNRRVEVIILKTTQP